MQDLTDEQIEMDLLLYIEDHPDLKKRGDSWRDTEYEQAMKADLAGSPPASQTSAPPPAAEDWEDAPLD